MNDHSFFDAALGPWGSEKLSKEDALTAIRRAPEMPEAPPARICERIQALRRIENCGHTLLEQHRRERWSRSWADLDPDFLEKVYEGLVATRKNG